jgi:hypothetical protein
MALARASASPPGNSTPTRSPAFDSKLCFCPYAKETRDQYFFGVLHCGLKIRPMRRDRRKNFRVEWNVPATIYDVGRHLERPCILVDISNGGAKIAGVRAHTIPEEFRLRTPLGDRRSCRVIWRTEDTLGVEFTDHIEGADSSGHRRAAREPTHA